MLHLINRSKTGAGRGSRETGQIIIMIAFAAMAMFAIVGLAIDAGRLYITKAELSRATDAAALSGILEFDGTANGLTRGVTACQEYFEANEPEAEQPECVPYAAENEMTVDASKAVDMAFLSVLGVGPQTVSAHSRSGFGVQFLDVALAIDATGSMDDGCNSSQNNGGCPIHEAKQAAQDFKDIMLGTSPEGNTAVGVTALRGCFRANPQTALAPMSSSAKPLCVLDDSSTGTWVTDLTYNLNTLETQIDNIFSRGGSGTNPCGGIAKGWEILEGPGNHMAQEDNLRFLILLSDGDSNYYGHYTYQSTPYASPHTYQSYECQPPPSCSDANYNVGGESSDPDDPCQDGVYQPAITVAEDDFNGPGSNCPSTWDSDSDYGWSGAAWTASSTDISRITSAGPNDTSCHVRIGSTGWMCRAIDLTGYDGGTLRFSAKQTDNWESGPDDALIQISTDTDACTTGAGFNTIETIEDGEINTSYRSFSEDLGIYVDQMIYIKFQGSTDSTSEYWYLDSIAVEAGDTGSSNGYQNGHNGSPASCSTAVKRERQLDMLTWDIAKAIEADGVEIFVVGFGTCDPDNAIYSDAQCDAQIGNNDHDNTADERLLKCIASSPDSTNDNYYYVASATDLPSIFTEIATQISHRLIE